MTTLQQKMQEILKTLGVDKKLQERFMRAAEQYDEEKQAKIFDILLNELERVKDMKKEQLQKLRKLNAEKRKFIEEVETENSVKNLEEQLEAL